jgi:hypothetical protein
VPQLLTTLTADASASASVSTSVEGSVSATGGLYYNGSSVSPIASFTRSFSFQPPTPQGQGAIGARLIPAGRLLIYGVAGPEVDLSGGPQLDVDTSSDSTWRLHVPIDLSAKLVVPHTDLKLGPIDVYKHDLTLGQGGTGGGGGGSGGGGGGSAQRTVQISWDTDQTDMDLHLWDAAGGEAWYSDQAAIPNGQLSTDITNGFGPETFTTTDTTTPLAIGVCYFASNTDDGSQPPTNVTVTITEADGSQRVDHLMLTAPGDEQLVDTSPGGSAAFSPNPGWCYNDNGGTAP